MSGIVGLLNLDGRPVDPALLRRMTEAMAFRGPDVREIWAQGPIGFGHALLRTTREAESERQPASLDGQVWITADARVDARGELIEKLEARGRSSLKTATDAELILHAYHVWGEGCVEHLLGDFAFATWDGRARRLFCARDHFGVRPFYYAQVGGCLVFSNSLNCLRLHPGVSDRLNDVAIGDFLLFGASEEPGATTFADIRRLPAAHALSWSAGELRLGRYWTLPVEGPVEYRQEADYLEHFRELLRTAVSDRLRTDRVAIFMSGGLDSSTVAATAKEVFAKRPFPCELRAHTVVYDWLIPDRERHYSDLVAKALAIPIQHLVADGYRPYERREEPEGNRPEPLGYPFQTLEAERFRQVAAFSRVGLSGDGGDPGLSVSLTSHFSRLTRRWQFGRLAADLGRYLTAEGRLSRLYFRRRLQILRNRYFWHELYPTWLNPAFEVRMDLRHRWKELNEEPSLDHPVRPIAYRTLVSPYWQRVFEGYDAGVTLSPVEARFPFFDLRVMRYLLRLPTLPWCADKQLLREAVRGILPDQIRLRPKTPLAGDPLKAVLRQDGTQWVDDFEPIAALADYVDRARVPPVRQEPNYYRLWLNIRPISLNYWLHYSVPFRYKSWREGHRETHGSTIVEETLRDS